MDIFEYVAVLTSIIIGLALAHLLRGVARLIQHPDSAKLYWVHLTWVFYTLLTTVFWWWWEFRLGTVEVWTFQLYLFVVFYAVLFYLLSALLFPDSLSGYAGFREYFYSRRRWFFGILLLANVTDIADSWLKGAEYFASLGVEYVLAMAAQVILCAVAILVRSPRFHSAFAVGLAIYQVSWALRMYETVA